MVFQYLESTLHALVVATSVKPQTNIQVHRLLGTTFVKIVCIKFEYVSEPVYTKKKTKFVNDVIGGGSPPAFKNQWKSLLRN